MHLGPVPLKYRVCAVAECGKRCVARGYCLGHYKKARRTGLAKLDRGERMVHKRMFIRADQEKLINKRARVSGKNASAIVRDALDSFLGVATAP